VQDFGSEVEAMNRIGGPFIYSNALQKGIGLPGMMLEINDILLHGGDEHISVLADQLAAQNWEGFKNPCFEPEPRFDKIFVKLLCRQDFGWNLLKNQARRRLGAGPSIRSLMSTFPKGFDRLPGQAHNELSNMGWEYMTQSQRTVFRKNGACLKIALDVDGLEQNFNESLFLRIYKGCYTLNVSARKKIEVRVPEPFSHHGRYLWTTREWVEGDVVGETLKQFARIREAIMNQFPIKDVKPNNLLWDRKLNCYWIIDPGIPTTKTY
jgi:hypothetical protein